MLDLSIRVLRADLQRIGRFDPDRRRNRMRANFDGGGMQVIEVDGQRAGCLGLDEHPDALELHSVFIEPARQGAGLGSTAAAAIFAAHPGRVFRLEVLKGSRARGFWEKHGFRLVGDAPFDWLLERMPPHHSSPLPPAGGEGYSLR